MLTRKATKNEPSRDSGTSGKRSIWKPMRTSQQSSMQMLRTTASRIARAGSNKATIKAQTQALGKYAFPQLDGNGNPTEKRHWYNLQYCNGFTVTLTEEFTKRCKTWRLLFNNQDNGDDLADIIAAWTILHHW